MLRAGHKLQVLNLIVILVEVNVMHVVLGRNGAIVKAPNVAMKLAVHVNVVTVLIVAVISDAVKALVRVVDDDDLHKIKSFLDFDTGIDIMATPKGKENSPVSVDLSDNSLAQRNFLFNIKFYDAISKTSARRRARYF